MKGLSLLAERHPLASPQAQRARLASLPLPLFDERAGSIMAGTIDTLQMNLGKVCNQTCAHCHVDAGPDRTEVMSDDTVDACLDVLERERIAVLDITGGAPELHPRFEDIVRRGRALGIRVLDRCNLSVLTLPRFAHLPRFFATQGVEVVASLPYWEAERTDAQRGDGVFDKSLRALRLLNEVGYASEARPELALVLVANPTGAFLPAPERALEADFRARLGLLGVRFTKLAALTNMPIARYLEWLDRSGNTERYMNKLHGAFNAAAVASVMCRTLVSVGWDGRLWDCDFNQMLEVAPSPLAAAHIRDFSRARWQARKISTDAHCFGCTAGQGSSCGGATA